MTLSLALVLAVLEILGLGVFPLEEGGVLALGPETRILGDVLDGGGGAPLVSWCGGLPEPDVDTRCFLGAVRPGGTNDRARRPVFQMPAALCGNSRLRLLRMAGGVAGTTECSDRHGNWVWAQLYDRGGEVRTVPLPVAPAPGSVQTAPVPVPGPDATVWVVWTDAEEGGRGLGRVRAVRLDSAGEPLGVAIDLSDSGAAITSRVNSHFGAAGLPGGGFAVVWPERAAEGHAVRLGIFDAAGRPAAPPLDLGSVALNPFGPLRIAADGSGRITAAWWRDEPDDGGTRLYAASFSPQGEPLVEPVPVTRQPRGAFRRIAALAASDGAHLLAWKDRDPQTGEPRIGLHRWSPELGPLGLTTWIPGTVTDSWPFLEMVPGDEAGRFILYWKETVEAPEGGLTAVLRWRELAVPE